MNFDLHQVYISNLL